MAPVDWLTRLWQLYHAGKGCFPLRMGLSVEAWLALQQRLGEMATPLDSEALSRRRLMTELNATRDEERRQLARWLAEWMAPGAEPMAPIVAGAALAFNHLWEDLGLDSRAELGRLMRDCFPQLVAQNVHHMRWKKFFYRQRCLQSQGEIVCRSPSCDECLEYSLCFEPPPQ
ncbi:nitrogen fixation protein NifQ [Klebsiella quasipneumoniae]|uniref:Nitrogen fixation protein NifQ n=1 Tax=Klebsiella quasipneumoniae TaxID=1463165 RepID=A0A8H9ZPZ3_9ENTR|nr:nitrogen fixation protein NifQ [Klebsiella quasipneumoniae]ELC0919420.1 nitrogen fixation protein NifQ [Klebsiella quasipneumoniae]MBC5044325.1 nitrogen fixation protein NifQ [Klebsiella quasipneumoniae]MDF3327829.1 nitrogen fixation protein NifQ [Klebsiella quasipneumoniae subsp. similipneumoniae]TNC59288.1 nitrogen fixation protein NifQ [Klebsiella quasipneumoniae]TNK07767.1 nitrogen fixation protein NifQ [Klebsiella quasipneumoniae subsp. similipneumoniae]